MSIFGSTGGSLPQSQKKRKADIVEQLAMRRRRIPQVLECGGEHFTEKVMLRMGRCRHRIVARADKTLEKKKIEAGESCKSPWCPACMLAQARRDAARIAVLMKWIQVKEGKIFWFVTLTAPNVTGDKLKEEITKYNKSFNKLMGREEVERAVKGYVRKLEVTYNKEPFITRDMWYGNKERHIKPQGRYFKEKGLKVGDANPNFDTYHTHFHVLLAVNRTYENDPDQHISKWRWLQLWREVMEDQTITQVDARRVTVSAGREVGEVAKYTAKDADYAVSPEVFAVYYRALTRRQKTTYGGLFADANKLYKEGELDELKEKDLTEYVYRLFYQWEHDGYLLADIRELMEQECAAIHGQTIEEMELEDG